MRWRFYSIADRGRVRLASVFGEWNMKRRTVRLHLELLEDRSAVVIEVNAPT